MNEKILDTPFENEFHFKLQDGEEIIWENEAYSSWSFLYFIRYHLFAIFFVMVCSIFVFIFLEIFRIHFDPTIYFGIIIFLIFVLEYFSQKQNPSKKYILTSNRLIFQTVEKKKNIILNIPLKNIKSMDVQLNGIKENNGNIILEIIDLQLTEEIKYFSNLNTYPVMIRLLLLNIDNTPKVLKLIRQARLKAKGI